MKHKPQRIAIGCAAGFAGDRLDAAEPVVRTLIRTGLPAFLIFETLAERTLAIAQARRQADPAAGYEPNLRAMVEPVLADCLRHGIRIVSNFGAANPLAAARLLKAMAAAHGLSPRIAVIDGDDLSGPQHRELLAAQLPPGFDLDAIVSANAYIGAEAIADALRAGADIVVAGRVADPSLAVGPAMASFGWAADDWDRLARATMAGHLLECGAQVCGGYFADPGYKDVPELHAVGFPVLELDEDGGMLIGKADGTGGAVSLRTVKEQLLYEVHDPAAYLTPDVSASIAEAEARAAGADQVIVSGVRGRPRPDRLKVNVCTPGPWIAEGEISYAGPGAEARARLAAEVLRRRLPDMSLRVDLIGVVSVLGDSAGDLLARRHTGGEDVRLRVASATTDRSAAERLAAEVTALYTCGPAGGGGVRTSLRSQLELTSCFVPRAAVRASFRMLERVSER
nr:acyclic terpene utilization AtuA family protein [Pelomonas sp. KK5]